MDSFDITYRFLMDRGREISFSLIIGLPELELVSRPLDRPPDWIRLDYHQCPNCPLTVKAHSNCPLCMAIAPVIRPFEGVLSHETIRLEVITRERTIIQRTTVQRALSSLFGLAMPVSGCPHTACFKPMARFHLPLANEQETVYRAASMHLLARHFISEGAGDAPGGLSGLKEIYRNVQTVNLAIAERLRNLAMSDSSCNALIILDVLAKTAPYIIDESLSEIRYLFRGYPGMGNAKAGRP